MSCTIAMLQKTPKAKAQCIGVYFLSEDNRIYVQTKDRIIPYKATLVTANGDVILSNCEAFLKELARQAKMSQVTYYYTTSEDVQAEYTALLTGSV